MGWQDAPKVAAWEQAPKVRSAPPVKKGSAVKQGVISLANGITANFLDRISAGLGTVLPDMGPNHASIWEGYSPGDAYSLNLQQTRGKMAAGRRDHPVVSTVGEVAGAVAPMLATGGGSSITSGMGYGAAYGAGSSEDLTNIPDVAKNVAKGGAMALAGNMAGRAVVRGGSRLLRGATRDPAAQRLAARGIRPTIGQSLGGRAKNIEDRLAGLPVVGGAIRQVRRNQFDDVLRAAADETLAPIGRTAPPAASGRELYAATKDIADDAYRTALSAIDAPVDQPLVQGIQQAAQRNLTAPQREAFDSIMTDEVLPRLQAGQLRGDDVQALKEVLDAEIKSYRAAPGYRGVVAPLRDVRDSLLDFVDRNAPDGGAGYQSARAAYGRAKTLQKAVESSTTDGIPTPRQIGIAARQSARRFGPGDAYARGNAPLQQLADDAAQVLPSAIPDPGTAGQLGFLNMLAHPIRSTPGVLGGAALSVPYSRAGDTALQALLFERPELLIRLGQQAPQLAAPFGMFGSGLAVTQSGR